MKDWGEMMSRSRGRLGRAAFPWCNLFLSKPPQERLGTSLVFTSKVNTVIFIKGGQALSWSQRWKWKPFLSKWFYLHENKKWLSDQRIRALPRFKTEAWTLDTEIAYSFTFQKSHFKVAEHSFGSLWVYAICQIMARERSQLTRWNLASEKYTDKRFWLMDKMWRFRCFHGNMDYWIEP